MPRQKGAPKTGGRKAGTPNRVTLDIRELAQVYGESALGTLVCIMGDASSPPETRIRAASMLLDRAYGKPTESIQASITQEPPELTGWALAEELKRRGLPTSFLEE